MFAVGRRQCRKITMVFRDGVLGQDEGDSPLMKVCRSAGLRRIGWHVLRHTYASHLMMRGAKPIEVQHLLGHASLAMTMRYSHLSPSARKAAAALLDEEKPRHNSGIRTARNS